MPLVFLPPEDSPLSQGDILKGVAFAVTATDNKLSAERDARFVLVVSRPCKALRDSSVIVAPVYQSKLDLSQFRQKLTEQKKEQKDNKPAEITLDRMRRFLAGVRDGGQFSDKFYLGNLEGGAPTRFEADLTMLSTIRVPKEAEPRVEWIKQHRVWRLENELARDLHVRLFNSFARLGFDDHQWYPDPDLQVLLTEGEAEVAQKKLALSAAEREVQASEAKGESPPQEHTKAVAKAREQLTKAEEELQPYSDEQKRRKG